MNKYTEPQPWVEKPAPWTENIRHLVRPVITFIAFIVLSSLEIYQVVVKGTHINEWYWYLTAVIVIFWFGDRFLKNLIEKKMPETYPPLRPRYTGMPAVGVPPIAPETPKPALEKAPVLEKPSQNITQPEIVPEIKPRKKSYWEMTPEEVTKDYLGFFETKVAETQKIYDIVTSGGYPEDIIKDQKAILDSQTHSLTVAKAMVESVKAGESLPSALGFIGYRIAGVPDNQIPDQVKIWLKNNP